MFTTIHCQGIEGKSLEIKGQDLRTLSDGIKHMYSTWQSQPWLPERCWTTKTFPFSHMGKPCVSEGFTTWINCLFLVQSETFHITWPSSKLLFFPVALKKKKNIFYQTKFNLNPTHLTEWLFPAAAEILSTYFMINLQYWWKWAVIVSHLLLFMYFFSD